MHSSENHDAGTLSTNTNTPNSTCHENITKPLMSVPNPKRSVPVNFLNLAEDEAYSPFAEDSQILGNSRSIKSPIMELNASHESARLNASTKTPEVFELLCDGQNGLPLDQRSASRGVIGSARKIKSSASVHDDSTTNDESHGQKNGGDDLFSLLNMGSHQVVEKAASACGGIGPWGHSTGGLGGIHLQSPICRPSSTPVYASTGGSLYGEGNTAMRSFESNILGSPTAAVSGGLAGDLHLTSNAQPLSLSSLTTHGARGRDRDYSFGSILGLGNVEPGTSQQSGGLIDTNSFGDRLLGDPTSRECSNASTGQFLGDNSLSKDPWMPAQIGMTREQAIRKTLPLGGTVSAPPLLNMYSYGFDSFNNTSAFASSTLVAGARFDPLASRYETATSTASSGGPLHGSVNSFSNGNSSAHSHQIPQQPLPQLQSAANIKPVDAESVEALVLRSCRDILGGAAEHSLKAVELANTLRARVGTDALARIREKWGGLLSLLEKHNSMFRVDRIPKNDKVTLLAEGDVLREGTALLDDSSLTFGDINATAGFSSKGRVGGEHAVTGNSAAPVAGSTATRCLHVGNVPANMTEPQLVREFEKFGQLEGLKLVSQRNGTRRFAFVTFQSIEQAAAARHALSKVHPWKSAISFAHKDFSGTSNGHNQLYSEAGSRTASHVPNKSITSSSGISAHIGNGGYAQGRMYQHHGGMSEFDNMSMLYQPGANRHMMVAQGVGGMNIPAYPYMNMTYGSAGYWMNPQSSNTPFISNLPSNLHHQQQLQFHHQQQASYPLSQSSSGQSGGGPIGSVSNDCPVLRRLCDDTYVPTQPWPADSMQDEPYCSAVVAQLQQFGGFTTVSKLRGFLRNRISAVDNIKSVPLKAMLVAYPQLFHLDSNHVYLVGSVLAHGNSVGAHEAATEALAGQQL